MNADRAIIFDRIGIVKWTTGIESGRQLAKRP